MTKPFVVLLSDKNDLNLRFIAQVLQHWRKPYVVLDPTVRNRNFDVTFEDEESVSWHKLVSEDGIGRSVGDARAVWSRGAAYFGGRYTSPGTSSNLANYESIYAYEFLWWTLKKCMWVNPLVGARHTANRLVQYQLAKKCGLFVPDQIVSSDPNALRSFSNRNHACIIKRISQGGMREAGPGPIKTEYFRSASLSDCGLAAPVLLQEYIEKDYELRVVVVGSHVFAAAIDSAEDPRTALDSRTWTQTELTYYRVTLLEEEELAIVRICRRLGFAYASVDLVRAKDGNLYFLEANGSGQWSFIEVQTGYPITETISRLLTKDM